MIKYLQKAFTGLSIMKPPFLQKPIIERGNGFTVLDIISAIASFIIGFFAAKGMIAIAMTDNTCSKGITATTTLVKDKPAVYATSHSCPYRCHYQ